MRIRKYNKCRGNVSWFVYIDKLRLDNNNVSEGLIEYNNRLNKNSVLGVN